MSDTTVSSSAGGRGCDEQALSIEHRGSITPLEKNALAANQLV
jgi:hypothetical protein